MSEETGVNPDQRIQEDTRNLSELSADLGIGFLQSAMLLVSFIGVALLTPLVSRPVVSLLGRIFSWSVPGKLGRLNSGRNPRRTAITAADTATTASGIQLPANVNRPAPETRAPM